MARRRGRRKSAKGQLSPAGRVLTEPSTPRSTNVNIPTSDLMDRDALDTRHAESTSDVPLYHDSVSKGSDAIRNDIHTRSAAEPSSSGFSLLSKQLRTPCVNQSPSTNDYTPVGTSPDLLSPAPKISRDNDEHDSSFSQHAEEFLSPSSPRSENLFDSHLQIIKEAENHIEEMKHELTSMSTEVSDTTREQQQLLKAKAKRHQEWIFSHELYLALVKTTIKMTQTICGVQGDDQQSVLEQPRRRVIRGWLMESIRRLPTPPEMDDPVVIDPESENLFQQISHFFLVGVIETNLDTVFKGRSLPSDTEMTDMFLRNSPERVEDWSDDIGPSLRKKLGIKNATSHSVEDVLNRLEEKMGPDIPEPKQSTHADANSIRLDIVPADSPLAHQQSAEQENTRLSSREWSIHSPSQRVYDPSFLASEEPLLSGRQHNETHHFDSVGNYESEDTVLARHLPTSPNVDGLHPTFLDQDDHQYLNNQRQAQILQQDRGGFEDATENSDLMEDDDDTVLYGTPYAETTLNLDQIVKGEQQYQPNSQPIFGGLARHQSHENIEGFPRHSPERDMRTPRKVAAQEQLHPSQVAAQRRLVKAQAAAMSAEEQKRLLSINQVDDSMFFSMSPSPGPSIEAPSVTYRPKSEGSVVPGDESEIPLTSEQSYDPSHKQDTAIDDQPPTFDTDYPLEDITMEDVQDTTEAQSREPSNSQGTVRARSRKSEPIVLISSQRSFILPNAIMKDTDFITDDEDDGISTSIHPMLAATSQGSAGRASFMPKSDTPTSSASTSRTSKAKLPPHLASRRRAAHRKSLDPSSAIPTQAERLEHSQEEYPLVDIVEEKVVGGLLKYRIKWQPINGRAFEDTWEPAENANEEAVRDWELIKEKKKARARKPRTLRASVATADVEMFTKSVVESPGMTVARIIDEKIVIPRPLPKLREITEAETAMKKIVRRQRLGRNEKKRQDQKAERIAVLHQATIEATEKTATGKKKAREKQKAKKLAKRLREETNKAREVFDGSRAGPSHA